VSMAIRLVLETAPRWPPDRLAIEGPPRMISSGLTRRPSVPGRVVGHALDIWSGKKRHQIGTATPLTATRPEFLYPTGLRGARSISLPRPKRGLARIAGPRVGCFPLRGSLYEAAARALDSSPSAAYPPGQANTQRWKMNGRSSSNPATDRSRQQGCENAAPTSL
jgi:hypothetical protein